MQNKPLNFRRLGAALGLLVAAGIFFFASYPSAANVSHIRASGKPQTQWVWLDYMAHFDPEGAFVGRLYLPEQQSFWLENSAGAQVTLTLDGETVYTGTTSALITPDGNRSAPINFRLDYQLAADFPPAAALGFMQDGLFGTRYVIPAWQYAPLEGDATGIPGGLLGDILRPLSLLMGLAACAVAASALRLTRRAWIGLALVFALSLGIRALVMHEKLAHGPGYWTMVTTWDNYVDMGRNWLAGYRLVAGDLFQQGNYIYLGLAQIALGPALGQLYWLNTLVGSLSAVLVTLAGWALFSNRRVGYLAGGLLALFAPLIHYQTLLQSDTAMIMLMSVLLALGAAFYRWPHPLLAVLCGLTIGSGTLIRGTGLIMLLWPLLILLLQKRSWRSRIGYGMLLGGFTALAILPITITNFNAGYRMLSPARGDYQMLRANNRDADGLNTYMAQSEQLTRLRKTEEWTAAFWQDIREDPWRVVGLTIRRVMLYWDPYEHSDAGMVDYHTSGLEASPVLRGLALGEQANVRSLLLLAMLGVGLGLSDPRTRKATLVISAGALVYMASLTLFYVIGRVRIPLVVFIVILAALALVQFWELVRQSRRRAAQVAMAGAMLAVATIFITGALIDYFPRPRLLSTAQLPADLVTVQGTFDDEIRLLGYGFYETNAQTYLAFDLYWQTLRPPSADYILTARFVNTHTQEIEALYNFRMGTMSPPVWQTSQWQPGDIFQERYLIHLPEVTSAQTYTVFVGLYQQEGEQLAALSAPTAEVQDNHMRLTSVQTVPPEAAPALTAGAADPLAVWDAALALESLDCTLEADQLTLRLDWYTVQRPTQYQQMFVHLLQAGEVVAQRDAPPLAELPLDAWIAGTRQQTTWTFDTAAAPISLRLGFYHPATLQRWPISTSQGIVVVDNYLEFPCE